MTGRELIEHLKRLPSEDLDLQVSGHCIEEGFIPVSEPWVDDVDEYTQRWLVREGWPEMAGQNRVIRVF